MLAPDDWREWVWGVANFASGEDVSSFPDRRIWRMTVTATAPATITIGSDNPSTLTLAANQTVVLEPKGMIDYVLLSPASVTAVVEYIRKV